MLMRRTKAAAGGPALARVPPACPAAPHKGARCPGGERSPRRHLPRAELPRKSPRGPARGPADKGLRGSGAPARCSPRSGSGGCTCRRAALPARSPPGAANATRGSARRILRISARLLLWLFPLLWRAGKWGTGLTPTAACVALHRPPNVSGRNREPFRGCAGEPGRARGCRRAAPAAPRGARPGGVAEWRAWRNRLLAAAERPRSVLAAEPRGSVRWVPVTKVAGHGAGFGPVRYPSPLA